MSLCWEPIYSSLYLHHTKVSMHINIVMISMCFSMAEDAVDAAIKSGKLTPANGCVTNNLCIVGGEGWEPSSFTVLAQQYKRMKSTYSGKVVPGVMDSAAARHLSHAYGTLAERVAAIAQVCFYCFLFLIVIFIKQQNIYICILHKMDRVILYHLRFGVMFTTFQLLLGILTLKEEHSALLCVFLSISYI
jgi:hypothetical protein